MVCQVYECLNQGVCTQASDLHMHIMLSYSATRKNLSILVVDLSFLKKAPLLRYVVQNLLVAVMRTLPQITMPPDSLTHHVGMCVVPK